MHAHRMIAILLAAEMLAGIGWAQEKASTGTAEEPSASETPVPAAGSDTLSDEDAAELQQITRAKRRPKTWSELVEEWMTAKPFDKKLVVKIDEHYAYPHIASSIKMQIVREDDQYVWLRGIPPEDPNSALYTVWARREADQAVTLAQAELLKVPGAVNYLNFYEEPVPPGTIEGVTFERVAANLPESGLWQMNFAVADMNEDGHADLVFPPRRKDFPPVPAIFIGDGQGGFRLWQEAKWPEEMPWDYGGVAVADFNGDGHQDVVFAVHFKSQFVLFGDGRGRFPSGGVLPSPDRRLSSRAVVAADFNRDGRPDLAFVAEIDYDLRDNKAIEDAPSVWVLFNAAEGWQIDTEGLPKNLITDVIRAADLDGDGGPELILSTNTFGRRQLVYHYSSDGWRAAEHRGMLGAAYHYDIESAPEGLFGTFVQFRMIHRETQARNGIVHYPPDSSDEEFVVGRPVVWDKERGDVFFRLATGDIDGDGRTDLVAGRKGGGLEIYLQTEGGMFYRERGDEFAGVGRVFDVRVLDLNGDGFDDIVASCVTQGKKPGGAYVWLTKPAA